jgi:hypothetical protein
MLFVAGRFDDGFAGSTRRWGRWAGASAEAVIVGSGEHGVDFFQLATREIQQRVTQLVLDFMMRVSEASANPLMGEWVRVNSCEAFVRAFTEAGLLDLAPEWLVATGYFRRVDQIERGDPCAGAIEDANSYFFEESGRFGSLDQDVVLVDDGTYRIVDGDTIAFDGPLSHQDVLADYRIGEDGRLSFDVEVLDNCATTCRQDLAWVLSSFYPGGFRKVT